MRKVVAVMQTAFPKLKQVNPAQPLDNPASFAKFVGVSAQCVRNWCKAGIIPLTIKAGRIVRFERAAAIAALNSTEAASSGRAQ